IGAAQPFGAARDAGLDPAAGDRVGDDRDRAQSGDAVRRDRLRLDVTGKPLLEDDLARQVRLAALGHDGAEDERIDLAGIDLVPIDEASYRVARQREGPFRRERFAGADERRPRSGDDGDSLLGHDLSFRLDATNGGAWRRSPA